MRRSTAIIVWLAVMCLLLAFGRTDVTTPFLLATCEATATGSAGQHLSQVALGRYNNYSDRTLALGDHYNAYPSCAAQDVVVTPAIARVPSTDSPIFLLIGWNALLGLGLLARAFIRRLRRRTVPRITIAAA